MKFLWGSKGATVAPDERYTKFESVITAMAEKFALSDELHQNESTNNAEGK